MKYTLPLCLLVCSSLSVALKAQTQEVSYLLEHAAKGKTWAKTITAEDLSNHLHVLASDEMQGRETGKEGQRMAATYIAQRFQQLGLEPINGSYFQQVPLKVSKLKGGVLSIGEEKLVFKNDFVPYPGIKVADLESDAVFVGYGIQDDGWDDFAGLDVKGKTVVYLSGVPEDKEWVELAASGEYERWSIDPSAKRNLADSLGAVAVMVVSPEFQTMRSRLVPWLSRERMRLDVEREGQGTDLPTLIVSEEVLLRVSGWKSMSTVRKKWSNKKLKGTDLGPMRLSLARMTERLEAANVWGFLPGQDSLLSEEVVVLTSHYDHVGVDEETGEVYNGADDDGSGTVSLLENAEAWMEAVKGGFGPRRSILFMAFVGEEKGLLGSEWYASNPAFPLEAHVCDLNMDMVGRFDEAHQDDDRYVYLIGSDKLSSELHEISEAVNAEHVGIALDYTFNAPDDPNRFYYRSDHYNFAKHNIPVIFYFSGVHEDYHGVGDTPDKIRYPKMAEIGRLVFLTSWEVANRNGKLEVDRVNDFPSNR